MSSQHVSQGSRSFAKKDGETPQFQTTDKEEEEGVQREWWVTLPYVTSPPGPLTLWKGAG